MSKPGINREQVQVAEARRIRINDVESWPNCLRTVEQFGNEGLLSSAAISFCFQRLQVQFDIKQYNFDTSSSHSSSSLGPS